MMPICQHKWCKKAATIKCGTVYNYEDSRTQDIYDGIYMCTKHSRKFIRKYCLKKRCKR